ncbi:MAG: Ig-like domain-containing protein [Roseovarius sp.]
MIIRDGTPTVTITGPTDIVTDDFTVTFTFSEDVSSGSDLFDVGDVVVTNGTKGTFNGSGVSYTLLITPQFGKTVSVSVAVNVADDAAGNGNTASNVFEVQAGSPASEFDKYREEIRAVVVDEAARSLQSTIAANQRMTRDARTRFIQSGQAAEDDSGVVSRNNVAFDVDGTFAVNDTTVSTSGEFFQQTGNYEGTQRRLFFGDFDVQHDGDVNEARRLNRVRGGAFHFHDKSHHKRIQL